jgi:hypothetical protein
LKPPPVIVTRSDGEPLYHRENSRPSASDAGALRINGDDIDAAAKVLIASINPDLLTFVLPQDALPLQRAEACVKLFQSRESMPLDLDAAKTVISAMHNKRSTSAVALIERGKVWFGDEKTVLVGSGSLNSEVEFHDDHLSTLGVQDYAFVRCVSPYAVGLREHFWDEFGSAEPHKLGCECDQASMKSKILYHQNFARFGPSGVTKAGKIWNWDRKGIEHNRRYATAVVGHDQTALKVALDILEKCNPERFISYGVINDEPEDNPRASLIRQFSAYGEIFGSSSAGFFLHDLCNAVADREALYAIDLSKPSAFTWFTCSEQNIDLIFLQGAHVLRASKMLEAQLDKFIARIGDYESDLKEIAHIDSSAFMALARSLSGTKNFRLGKFLASTKIDALSDESFGRSTSREYGDTGIQRKFVSDFYGVLRQDLGPLPDNSRPSELVELRKSLDAEIFLHGAILQPFLRNHKDVLLLPIDSLDEPN